MEDPDFDEVVIVSSANTVTVCDANTRKSLKIFKHETISPNCLALLGDDYIIGALMNKPQISAFAISDTRNSKRVVSPCGVITALAATSNGSYVVASIKEQIRVWDVKSGEMLAAFSRHYQTVTCLRFTNDGSMFLSGGKEGIVFVWVLASVTAVNSDQERVKPLRTWNNHSKEVTDIFVGSLGIHSRVATSSADMTCKIYELDTGILLTTICMDVVLTSVVMDPFEYHVFLGSEVGTIYKINLYNELPRELHNNTMEKEKVNAHSGKINSLSISVAGDKLLSSSTDRTCKVWNVASLTSLSTLPIAENEIITNAFFAPYPVLLHTREEPSFVISPLERTFDKSKLPTYKKVKLHHYPLTLINDGSADEICDTDLLSRAYTKVNLENAADPAVAENIFQEAFRGETVNDVRGINAQLYSYLMEKVFSNIESNPNDSSSED